MRKRLTFLKIMIIPLVILLCFGGVKVRNWYAYNHQKNDSCEMVKELFASMQADNEEDYLDAIRDYAYANLEFSGSSELNVDIRELIFNNVIPWEDKIFELYETNTIEPVGYCGGTAFALAVVYNMLGYKSCTLDMAVFDDDGSVVGSHVVTLVEINDKWIVEDATFNLTYKENGEYISIYELIDKVKQNETESIEIIEGSSLYRGMCTVDPVYDGDYQLRTEDEWYVFEQGYYSYYCMKPEMWSGFDNLYEYFNKDGYEMSTLGIYAYPYAVYYPNNSRMNIFEQITFTHSIINS